MSNILIACEFSGRVRDAFRKKGHNAWSCDLIPDESDHEEIYHLIGNAALWIDERPPMTPNGTKWDMLIAFPPCTYTCFSGIRWNVNNPQRQKKTEKAIEFFKMLWECNIEKICIENPIGVIPRHTDIKWSQIIHPWQFGEAEEKKTCLWLKNLPLLEPTKIMKKREQRIFKMSPSKDRSKLRSITFQGIANAMAEQWG